MARDCCSRDGKSCVGWDVVPALSCNARREARLEQHKRLGTVLSGDEEKGALQEVSRWAPAWQQIASLYSHWVNIKKKKT